MKMKYTKMKYNLYRILIQIAHLNKDLVNYHDYFSGDTLGKILKNYAKKLRKKMGLVHKVESTTDPNVFNVRAYRIKDGDWNDEWDVSTYQVVFGVDGAVFYVSLYKPYLEYLTEARNMIEHLPDWEDEPGEEDE